MAINEGILRSEFAYDGAHNRTRIVEKNNGIMTADRRFVFAGLAPSEERDGGNAVVKQFFGKGFRHGSSNFYWIDDHLGSVRDVTDSSGGLRARYEYDPWGRQAKTVGDVDAQFGYAGHFSYSSTLHLAPRRAYDSSIGRWTSVDPAGLIDGPNRYSYVGNGPISHVDPTGLAKWDCVIVAVSLGGGPVAAKCKSRCLDRKKVHASYIGSVVGFGADLGDISLTDPFPVAEAVNLEGFFGSASAGIAGFGLNLSWQGVFMGEGIGFDYPWPDWGAGNDLDYADDFVQETRDTVKRSFLPRVKPKWKFDAGGGGFFGAMANVTEYHWDCCEP